MSRRAFAEPLVHRKYRGPRAVLIARRTDHFHRRAQRCVRRLCPHMENQKLGIRSEIELIASLGGNAQKEKEIG